MLFVIDSLFCLTKLRFERAVRSIRRIGSDKLDLLPNIVYLQVWSDGVFTVRRSRSQRNKGRNRIDYRCGRWNTGRISSACELYFLPHRNGIWENIACICRIRRKNNIHSAGRYQCWCRNKSTCSFPHRKIGFLIYEK